MGAAGYCTQCLSENDTQYRSYTPPLLQPRYHAKESHCKRVTEAASLYARNSGRTPTRATTLARARFSPRLWLSCPRTGSAAASPSLCGRSLQPHAAGRTRSATGSGAMGCSKVECCWSWGATSGAVQLISKSHSGVIGARMKKKQLATGRQEISHAEGHWQLQCHSKANKALAPTNCSATVRQTKRLHPPSKITRCV